MSAPNEGPFVKVLPLLSSANVQQVNNCHVAPNRKCKRVKNIECDF